MVIKRDRITTYGDNRQPEGGSQRDCSALFAMETKVITQKEFKMPNTHCSAGYQMVIKKTTGQLSCQVTTNVGN